jgi:nucleotide-binding universal stress UspA family protein
VFSNVIVGVDGGLHGGDALALARRLAAPGGELRLVHLDVGDWAASGLPDGETVGGVKVVTESAPSVGDGLHRLAEERGADLLVVGSSRRGMFGRVLLGDDTRASLNGAPCAVAIAPSGFSARESPFSVVGVAYNESRESEEALATARDLAKTNHLEVRALQVVPTPSYGEELAAFGAEVDLLVVGSRGYGPLQRLIHGSTSDYLMRHARCALLILARGSVPGPTAVAAVGAEGAAL